MYANPTAGSLTPINGTSTSTFSTFPPQFQHPAYAAANANLHTSTTIDQAVLTQASGAPAAANPSLIDSVASAASSTSATATGTPALPTAAAANSEYLFELDSVDRTPNTDLQQPSPNTNLSTPANYISSNALPSIATSSSPFAPSSPVVTTSMQDPVPTMRSAKAGQAPAVGAPKRTNAGRPSTTRGTTRKGGKWQAWTEEEKLLVDNTMRMWAHQGRYRKDSQKTIRWKHLSLVLEEHGYSRTYLAVRNYWDRFGRTRTGIEDRSENRIRNPGQLATSVQTSRKRSSAQAGAQTQRRAKRPRITSTTITIDNSINVNGNNNIILRGYGGNSTFTAGNNNSSTGTSTSTQARNDTGSILLVGDGSAQAGNNARLAIENGGSSTMTSDNNTSNGVLLIGDGSTQTGYDNPALPDATDPLLLDDSAFYLPELDPTSSDYVSFDFLDHTTLQFDTENVDGFAGGFVEGEVDGEVDDVETVGAGLINAVNSDATNEVGGAVTNGMGGAIVQDAVNVEGFVEANGVEVVGGGVTNGVDREINREAENVHAGVGEVVEGSMAGGLSTEMDGEATNEVNAATNQEENDGMDDLFEDENFDMEAWGTMGEYNPQ